MYCFYISKPFLTTGIDNDFLNKLQYPKTSVEQNCPKINILNSHMGNKKYWIDENCLFIAISFYLFIAISCAKMLSVYKP